MQNFSNLVQGEDWGRNGKLAILKIVRDRAKVTIDH